MTVIVVPYSEEWPRQYEAVADGLRRILSQVPVVSIQHVGSTSVPGLAAKPVLDIDVIVQREHVPAAIRALSTGGDTPILEILVFAIAKLSTPSKETQPETSIYVLRGP